MKIKNYLLGLMLIAYSVAFPQTGTTYTRSIKSAGLTAGTNVTRNYRIYIPTYCANNPTVAVPLIFNFHGTGSNAQQQQAMCGFDKIADTAHFINVYPDGLVQPNSNNQTAWNSLGTVQENKDTDLKFVDNLLDTVRSMYSINTCKVYATGMSIGGYMTYDVGCFLNSRFAAIASVTGIMNPDHLNACNPSHPTPVMDVHGDNDNVVPYNGFAGTGVTQVLNFWKNYDVVGTSTMTALSDICTTDGCTAENYLNPGGTNGSTVEQYKILGGGHTWPRLPCGSTSGTNNDFSASMAIWKFFRKYCLDDLNGTPPACTQPSVTTQPNNTTICAGGNTSFGIAATGDGLTYQWQVDDGTGYINVPTSSPYSTATTATLTLTGATSGLDGYKYKCVVSGTCTPATSATSNQAVLIIPAAPTATVSGDATICSGTSATITIAFTGTGPWTVTKAVNGVNQTPVSPPSSPYTFNASASGVITVAALTDNTGCSGTSSGSATVKVISAITTSNKTETCSGGNADYTVEFDVAGGDTATYAVTGGSGTFSTPTHFISDPIASGTSYSLTITDAYTCGTSPVVSGTKTCGGGCSDATATISGDATICSGTSATISVALTGTSPWLVTIAVDGVDQAAVTANSSPYTFTTDTAGVYTVSSIIGYNNCNETLSGSATIVVNSTISTSNKTETCNGGNTDYVVEFDISGGDGTYTVTDGTMTTSTHYTSDPIASGTSYSITVSDSYNCSPITVTGTKTCSSGGCNAAATMSGDATICQGSSSTITVALTGTGPWSFAYSINGGTPITATSTTSTYTFAATTAGVYTLSGVTDNTSCSGSTSGTATIAVNSAISTSNKTETCSGSNYVVEFDISGGDPATYAVTGGAGSLTTGTHFTSAPIASGTAYSFTVNDQYACSSAPVVSGNKTCAAPGCTATAAISGNATICSGTSATISIALAGNGPWSFAYTINGGSPITATSNSSTYTFSANTAGTYALSGVTDATPCSGTTSGSATVVVNSAITTSSAITTCSTNNSTYTVEFDISGGNPASYSVSGGTITNGNHFTSNPINSGTAYSFTVNDANNCAPVTVSGTKTCVNTGPCSATATMSGGGTICNGSNSTLTVVLTGQAPWNFTIDPGNITIINQNTSPFTITTTVAGTFSVTAIGDATCTGTSSGSAVVTSCYVGPPPTGIEENSSLNDISIYPNPTSGNITISIKNALFNELQITIIDMLGTEVYSEIDKGVSADYLKQINLENIPSGMYYIQLSNSAESMISKLIIQ